MEKVIEQFTKRATFPFDDRDAVERKTKLEMALQEAREIERKDFLWLVGDKRGRRILWTLFSEAKLFENAFEALGNQGTDTALRLAYIEGTRASAYRLFNRLKELAPMAFEQMIQEQKEITNGSKH